VMNDEIINASNVDKIQLCGRRAECARVSTLLVYLRALAKVP
jgi:hypothetical protein